MEDASADDNINDYLQNARIDIDYTNLLGNKALVFMTREKF
jgi:hypothetical protein